jgi:hypothetical protein
MIIHKGEYLMFVVFWSVPLCGLVGVKADLKTINLPPFSGKKYQYGSPKILICD